MAGPDRIPFRSVGDRERRWVRVGTGVPFVVVVFVNTLGRVVDTGDGLVVARVRIRHDAVACRC